MNIDNPKIPEGINVSKEHPLKEFIILPGGALVLILLIILNKSVLVARARAIYLMANLFHPVKAVLP